MARSAGGGAEAGVTAAQEQERFGRYVLLERLGAGGMGEVWKARSDSGLGCGKLVALKRMRAALGDDPAFVAMFVEEVRVSLELAHANVVQVFDAGREAGCLFLVMELVAGPDLARLLGLRRQAGNGVLPPVAALWIGREVARALGHAHALRGADGARLGLVHRDVSPANILCGRDGTVKLGDFGLAQTAARAYRSLFGDVKGKTPYMAPEQARGEPLDGRADLFGLGATLYQALCGVHPYAHVEGDVALMRAVQQGAWRPPREIAPELPGALLRLLETLLAPRLDGRPRDAAAAVGAIEAAAAECGLSLGPTALAAEIAAALPEQVMPAAAHPFARALQAGLGLSGATGEHQPPQMTARLEPVPAALEPSDALEPEELVLPSRWRRLIAIAIAAAALGFLAGWLTRPRVPVTRAEVVGFLNGLDGAQLAAVTRELEGKWGVSAAPGSAARAATPVAATPPPAASPAAAPPPAPGARAGAMRPPVLRPRVAAPPAAEPAAAAQAPVAVVSFGSSPWAEVSIDGRPLCRTPLGCRNLQLAAGRHELRFVNPEAHRCHRVTTELKAGPNPPLVVDLDPCP